MYTRMSNLSYVLLAVLLGSAFFSSSLRGQSNVRYAKQGFSMRLCFDNRGAFGRVAYPGVIGGIDPGSDSIGLEYPIGQPYEHIFGAGLWIGGKLDTSLTGTSAPLTLVTTGYEGWSGPYFEFFPGSSPADSIWKVTGRGVPRPPSWNGYWDNLIPTVSFSDNDHYCLYDDAHVNVPGHAPLRLRIAQSSYVWDDSYAEAIHIMEYRIVNIGVKQIDSAYIGLFLDGTTGPYGVPYYYRRNYTGYYPDIRLAYVHNPIDVGATPVGIAPLTSPPSDSLRHAFRWWSGVNHPNTDGARYQRLSSGVIDSNQPVTSLSDTRCLVSFGPYTIRPAGPSLDTLKVAFCIVCGQSLSAMREHAVRAKAIYENGGVVSVNEPVGELATRFRLERNFPNPFNPTTTIRFELGRTSHVRLVVLNILGEEVAALVDGSVQRGVHYVVWDASMKPSGVYFYRIQTDQFVETRKMILLR